MRAENQKLYPKLFNKRLPACTRFFFRGEAVSQLLGDTDYIYFLHIVKQVNNVEKAFYLTQDHITQKRLKKEADYDKSLRYL